MPRKNPSRSDSVRNIESFEIIMRIGCHYEDTRKRLSIPVFAHKDDKSLGSKKKTAQDAAQEATTSAISQRAGLHALHWIASLHCIRMLRVQITYDIIGGIANTVEDLGEGPGGSGLPLF